MLDLLPGYYNSHHMEGIERPVMKGALEEEKERENATPKDLHKKEPTGLSERIDEKNRSKDKNRTRKQLHCMV